MLFVTDLGDDVTNGDYPIERYGVWAYDEIKGKDQVLETSNDLEYLLNKYNISSDTVVVIPIKGA